MNKALNKTALNFALAGIGVKLTTFYFALPFEIGIFGYFLFILFALFLGMRKHIIQNGFLGFGDVLKAGMKIGSIYTLLVAIFTYVYYRFIDYNFFPGQIAERMLAGKEAGMSDEQIVQMKDTLEFVFSASTQTTATLIGFMFVGFIYALIWTLIFTKIPRTRGV